MHKVRMAVALTLMLPVQCSKERALRRLLHRKGLRVSIEHWWSCYAFLDQALARCLRCKKAGPAGAVELAACKTLGILASLHSCLQAPLAPNSWLSASKKGPGQDDGQVATRLYRARGADVDRPDSDYTAASPGTKNTPVKWE